MSVKPPFTRKTVAAAVAKLKASTTMPSLKKAGFVWKGCYVSWSDRRWPKDLVEALKL